MEVSTEWAIKLKKALDAVAAGPACADHQELVKHVLTAMGIDCSRCVTESGVPDAAGLVKAIVAHAARIQARQSAAEPAPDELLTETMLLKGWDEYRELVAQAYVAAPSYDAAVVGHWQTLNQSNHTLFKRLLSRVKIIFVSGEQAWANKPLNIQGQVYQVQYLEGGQPYDTQPQMRGEYQQTGSLRISIDYSDHPIFSVTDNIIFRTVHDFIVHIQGNHPFGAKGEIASYNLHSKLAPREALPALFTEVVGQACFAVTHGGFPEQKIAVLKGFDYQQVGKVEGYDIENKQLTQNGVPLQAATKSHDAGAETATVGNTGAATETGKSAILAEGPVSAYRDNKYFPGADIKYPDVIFAQLQDERQARVAIEFYQKQVAAFNKLFNRRLQLSATATGKAGVDQNFRVVVRNENGLEPEYFAYPTGQMGQHTVQRFIDKFVPGTSLRHELLHEVIKPFITEKFELGNQLDKSAENGSIEDIQRARAFSYSLEDVFYERVVEHLERLPDFADTFPMGDFAKDWLARLAKEYGPRPLELGELLKTQQAFLTHDGTTNRFLLAVLPKLLAHVSLAGITDLTQLAPQLGKGFELWFNAQKNIFAQELQAKLAQFGSLFMQFYQEALAKFTPRTKATTVTEPLQEAADLPAFYQRKLERLEARRTGQPEPPLLRRPLQEGRYKDTILGKLDTEALKPAKESVVDTFSHDGQDYDLLKVKAILVDTPVKELPVTELEWLLTEMGDLDEDAETELDRLESVDITNPVIVTCWHDKWLVLDGAHRLKIAVLAHLEKLPAREISKADLAACRV